MTRDTDLIRLRAENDALKSGQTYRYIGKDGKSVLARDLEDDRDALRAEVATLRASEARMREALALASNRLHRCSVDYDTGTREFIETGEWAAEARAALQGETQ